MASQLKNLQRKLTWSDFGTPRKDKPRPQAGASAQDVALTDTKFSLNFAYAPVQGGVELKDTVTVEIKFLPSSWVVDWLFEEPKALQDRFLHHEQGHYAITALMGRDAFIDIMQLKGRVFANGAALTKEVNAIAKRYFPDPHHKKYDDAKESAHAMNRAGQAVWDGFFNRAFTQPRAPAVKAPDGSLYKVRLLDLLEAAGKG